MEDGVFGVLGEHVLQLAEVDNKQGVGNVPVPRLRTGETFVMVSHRMNHRIVILSNAHVSHFVRLYIVLDATQIILEIDTINTFRSPYTHINLNNSLDLDLL